MDKTKKKKKIKGYSGTYTPKNKTKYVGNVSNIVYRSLWERRWMVLFDEDPRILRWSSEEIIIPYYSPIDEQNHRYFPDFYIEYKNPQGQIKKVIIEVKPKVQTAPPTVPASGRKTKSFLNECLTFVVNSCKWEAATDFCAKRGFEFRILTEDHFKDMTGIFK